MSFSSFCNVYFCVTYLNCQAVSSKLHSFSFWDISGLARSLHKMRVKNEDLYHNLAKYAISRLNKMGNEGPIDNTKASFISAFGEELHIENQADAVKTASLDRKEVNALLASRLADLAWVFSRVYPVDVGPQYRDRRDELLTAVCHAASGLTGYLTPPAHARMMAGLASTPVGRRSNGVLHQLARQAHKHMSSYTEEEIVLMVSALAQAELKVPALYKAATDELTGLVYVGTSSPFSLHPTRINNLSTQGLVRLLTAYGTAELQQALTVCVDVLFIDAAAALLPRTTHMTGPQISNVMWAFAVLGVQSEMKLLKALVMQARVSWHTFDPMSLKRFLESVELLGLRNELVVPKKPHVGLIFDQLEPVLNPHPLQQQQQQ
eukprot:Colp12_sorted_trinity150504_noHs@27114